MKDDKELRDILVSLNEIYKKLKERVERLDTLEKSRDWYFSPSRKYGLLHVAREADDLKKSVAYHILETYNYIDFKNDNEKKERKEEKRKWKEKKERWKNERSRIEHG